MLKPACPDALANSFLAETCRAFDAAFDLDAERIAEPALWQFGAVLLVGLLLARLRAWRYVVPPTSRETGLFWPEPEGEPRGSDLDRIGSLLSRVAVGLGAPDGGASLAVDVRAAVEMLHASPASAHPVLGMGLNALGEEIARLRQTADACDDTEAADVDTAGDIAFRAAALAHCFKSLARRLRGEVWSDGPLLNEAGLTALEERFGVDHSALRYLEPLTMDETFLSAGSE
ncbi:hypothetical protein HDIA_0525 [Hartmannibacter diazotrophicus]|uniref:Uncharacterized protein n=1 Tax=Hartmannibacter diazotrophicus TaxID=1482074 RepID=A0A2C9D1E4_9HYPH|nr:hypothetical protein [Hartmannibacter diazotrophicus]SON54066.1 hypothetical protein HDIA_0525 [Hartmannibacter diazotrophicus]